MWTWDGGFMLIYPCINGCCTEDYVTVAAWGFYGHCFRVTRLTSDRFFEVIAVYRLL